MQDYEHLKNASVYFRFVNKVKSTAISSLIFGGLALYLGFQDFQSSANILVKFFALILMFIGLLLLVEGAVGFFKPSPFAMRLGGIAVILVGFWNVFVGLISLIGGDINIIFLFLGGFQVYWGVIAFKEAGDFDRAYKSKPEPGHLEEVRKLVDRLKTEKVAGSPHILEFTGNARSKTVIFKGEIKDDILILLEMPENTVNFLQREEIEIEYIGKQLIGDYLKIEIMLPDAEKIMKRTEKDASLPLPVLDMKGSIKSESLDKFNKWKKGPPSNADIGDEEFYKAAL